MTLNIILFCQLLQENETWRLQDLKIEQRRKQREDQQTSRKKDGKAKSLRSQSIPSGKETGSIMDKLLGKIGLSSRKAKHDEDGDSADGNRPQSPCPEDDQQSVNFVRSTSVRRSKQKFEQNLNAITESVAEATNPVKSGVLDADDRFSSSSGFSSATGTWSSSSSKEDSPGNTMVMKRQRSQAPRPLSADDDSLFDMLAHGNDYEALAQFEPLKRDGSLRRSGRRTRKNFDLASIDTRERCDSPSHSPTHSRRDLATLDSVESTGEPHSAGSQKLTTQLSVTKERERIRELMREEDAKNPMALLNTGISRRARSEISPTDVDLVLQNTGLVHRTDKASAEIKKDRVAKYSQLGDNAATEIKPSTHGMSSVKSSVSEPISSEQELAGKEQTEQSVNNQKSKPDSIPSRKKLLRRSQSELNVVDVRRAAMKIRKAVENSERTPLALPGDGSDDGISVEDKVSNWQNKFQSIDVEAALDTVESHLSSQEMNRSKDDPDGKDTPQKQRYTRWRTGSFSWDTPKQKEERTERRKSSAIYEDHESNFFLDRPIEAGLANGSESYAESYSLKIRQERRTIEQIMAGVDESDDGPSSPTKTSSEVPVPTMKGLQALRAKYKEKALYAAFNEEETWASIDRQQVKIRRDLLDMKVTSVSTDDIHVEDIEDVKDEEKEISLPGTQTSETVYKITDEDVYFLKDQPQNLTVSESHTEQISVEKKVKYPGKAHVVSGKSHSTLNDENDNEIQPSHSKSPRSKATPTNVTAKKSSPFSRPVAKSNVGKTTPKHGSPTPRISPSKSRSAKTNSTSPLTTLSPRVRRNISQTTPPSKSSSVSRSTLHTSRSADGTESLPKSETKTESRHRRESSHSNSSTLSTASHSSLGSSGFGRNTKSARGTAVTTRDSRSNSAASSCSVDSDRKPRASSLRSNTSSSSVRSTGSRTLPSSTRSPISSVTQRTTPKSTVTRTGPFNRTAPERRTMPASNRVPSNTGVRSSGRVGVRKTDKPVNKNLNNKTTADCDNSSVQTTKRAETPSLCDDVDNASTVSKDSSEFPSPERGAQSNVKMSPSVVKSRVTVQKSASFHSKSTTRKPLWSPKTPTATQKPGTRSPGNAKTTAATKNPLKMGSASFGLSDLGESSSTVPQTGMRGLKIQTGISLNSTAPVSSEKLAVDASMIAVSLGQEASGEVSGAHSSSLSSGEMPLEGTSAHEEQNAAGDDPKHLPRTSSLYSSLSLRSNLTVSEDSAEESDSSCRLERGSTLSLPPEVRKRGLPANLARKSGKGTLSKIIQKLGRKTDKGQDSLHESGTGNSNSSLNDLGRSSSKVKRTVSLGRKSSPVSTKQVVQPPSVAGKTVSSTSKKVTKAVFR